MSQHAQPHSNRLRLGRMSLPHQIYLVTLVTGTRDRLFSQHESAAVAARCIYDETVCRHAGTLAFVVMPEHVHWLIQIKEKGSLSDAVRLYKAKVSLRLNRRIWQPGFHDHALRAEEDMVSVARYLVANPLRAGLCGKIGDYPYWNAIWL